MLQQTTPEQARANPHAYLRYGIEMDCPIFYGLFDFCRLYAGASIGAPGGAPPGGGRGCLGKGRWAAPLQASRPD